MNSLLKLAVFLNLKNKIETILAQKQIISLYSHTTRGRANPTGFASE